MSSGDRQVLQKKRVLVVGIGGLGCPAAIVLARAGVGTIGIADDDDVDLTNLHRQVLFEDADVGKPKTDVAVTRLSSWTAGVASPAIVPHRTRLLPTNAIALVRDYDLVVEGSDNFATKFLAADACAIANKPIVHAAAVRWHGTALAVAPHGAPCYRCVFEDLPLENPPNCAEAGVVGPMVGVVAAAQADLALSALLGDASVFGELFTFDGKSLTSRRRHVAKRSTCALCGDAASMARIQDINEARYVEGICAAG